MATLWLVGMMGSGKSTIGPLVAARLGRPWRDTDDEVAAMAGAPVADLVAADEPRFRALERAAVSAFAGSDAVVSCGGGVVLDPETVLTMRASGVVVWLRASTEVLASRVDGGIGRPLIGEDAAASLEEIAAGRDGAYRAAAHVIVDAGADPDAVTAAVEEAWTRST